MASISRTSNPTVSYDQQSDRALNLPIELAYEIFKYCVYDQDDHLISPFRYYVIIRIMGGCFLADSTDGIRTWAEKTDAVWQVWYRERISSGNIKIPEESSYLHELSFIYASVYPSYNSNSTTKSLDSNDEKQFYYKLAEVNADIAFAEVLRNDKLLLDNNFLFSIINLAISNKSTDFLAVLFVHSLQKQNQWKISQLFRLLDVDLRKDVLTKAGKNVLFKERPIFITYLERIPSIGIPRFFSEGPEEFLKETTPEGLHPLHIAATGLRYINTLVKTSLLKIYKGQLDQKTLDGRTPLHVAAQNNQAAFGRMLLEQQPQLLWKKMNNGSTAMQLAKESDNHDFIAFLRKYEEKYPQPFDTVGLKRKLEDASRPVDKRARHEA